ncbi:MAG: glycosyltransferase family 9 protein [Bacteroidales bacterium]|nr:glycosyltransferase family 9 protein [Bacteroidales bacterium]
MIIRLSSIGDIVLTTNAIRCIKTQIPDAQLHYLLKKEYAEILTNNPYLTKIHTFKPADKKLLTLLKAEKFDYIIDLQHNYRSLKLCRKLKVPVQHLHKLNVKKWLLVNLKLNLLPKTHVVDRYLDTTAILPQKIKNDGKGLDFFLSDEAEQPIKQLQLSHFVAIAMGSKHFTKQIPLDKLQFICSQIHKPIVLLGGNDCMENAKILSQSIDNQIFNLCGKLTIPQSAACIKYSDLLLSGDTGLMHIAAALNKPIISLWGNTTADFGMTPYFPNGKEIFSFIAEVKNLKCRPCSKLGFSACPKKHFKCMYNIDYQQVINLINQY